MSKSRISKDNAGQLTFSKGWWPPTSLQLRMLGTHTSLLPAILTIPRFQKINSLISLPPSQTLESLLKSVSFSIFLLEKNWGIRLQISLELRDLYIVSSPRIANTLNLMSPSHDFTWHSSSAEVIFLSTRCYPPPKFLKNVFYSINNLSIVNCFLSFGSFPASLKHAIFQPLLKKQCLDPLVLDHF